MIELYAWKTGNCKKISIMLEECQANYNVKWIDISKEEQFSKEYLAINPNNKVPAIVDDGIKVIESGAILIYLAEKHKKLLPEAEPARSNALGWLMFQLSGIGPIFGQKRHFDIVAPQKIDYAIGRFTDETYRLLGVLEKQLTANQYISGEYSIADVSTYPWIKAAAAYDIISNYAALNDWMKRLEARPAVIKGMNFGED